MSDELEKALERIRAAAQQLSTSISRHAFVRLAAFAIFVFAVANATEGFRSAEIYSEIKEIRTLGIVSGTTDEPSPFEGYWFFNWLFRSSGDEGPLSFHPANLFPASQRQEQQKDEAYAVLVKYKRWKEITDAGKLSEAQIKRDAQEQQDFLAEKIRDAYRSLFQVEFSLVGAKLNVDLRTWFLLFPIILLLSQMYLSIEQHKLALLRTVISAWVPKGNNPTPAAVDQLLLTTEAAERGFGRYPSVILSRSFSLAQFGLLIYLLVAIKPWLEDTWSKLFVSGVAFGVLIGPGIYWAVGYVRSAKRKLDQQTIHKTNVSIPAPRETRLQAIGNRLTSRPARLLKLGSLLVLLSLLLPLGGCLGHLSGYRVLLRLNGPTRTAQGVDSGDRDDFAWYSVPFANDAEEERKTLVSFVQESGYTAYVLSVFLSVVTIGALLVRRQRGRTFLLRAGRFISSLCLCFLVADLFSLWLPPLKFLLLPIGVLVPFILTVYRIRDDAPHRRILAPGHFPFVLGAFITLIDVYLAIQSEQRDLYRAEIGMFALLSGVWCLTAGYWRSSPESLATPPS